MGRSSSNSSNSTTTTTTARQQQTKDKKDLRKGKWTPEEEEYASRIIYFVQNGILELPEGTTLRSYLAERLNCDPMRITKKIAGASCCLGKRSTHFVAAGAGRAQQQASPREISMAKAELEQLEERFKLRQKLGNCNLPLHIWPELYTQRSAAASTVDSAPEVAEQTPLVVLPPPLHYPISMQEAATTSSTISSSLDKNFCSSNPTTTTTNFTADGLAPSANEMSKIFQSYMALPASSSSSHASPSMVAAGGTTTSGAAAQFTATLPQYQQQQQQPVEIHSTMDPNSFTTNLLASMFPNFPSPTFGSTNSNPLKAAATTTSSGAVAPPKGNTITTGLPQLSLPQPDERTSTPNSLLPVTASPSMYPISSQSTLIINNNNNNNAWVNQQSLPSTPVFPNL